MTRALTFYRGRVCAGSLTYPELQARIATTAGILQQLGVTRGDRVAILSPNCLEVPVMLFALWHLGAIAVPLNPNGPPEEWRHILSHSGARGCFTSRELFDAIAGAPLEFARLLDESQGPPAPPASSFRDDPAVILYTSGTTAQPKGVLLSQRNLLANAWSLARHFSLRRTTQLAVLPLYHAHALGFGLMSALSTGGHLVFTDRFDPLTWAEVIRAESVSVTSLVPPLLSLLLSARITIDRAPSLRALLVSSAPLSTSLAYDALVRARLPLVHGWGLSEYTNFACCVSPRIDEAERQALLCEADPPSVGAALDGTDVQVRDEAGEPAPIGQPGELWVRGHSRMIGYYADAEATHLTTHDGWLRTGDLGIERWHRGRSHFAISGRIKEIIIRGGEKYSPVAVEQRLLAEVPELAGRLVVLGFPHVLQGEEVGAYIEASALAPPLELKILRAIERIPAQMRPKIILHANQAVPRTHTGKVQRRKLMPLFDRFRDHLGGPRVVSFEAPSGSAPGSSASGPARD